MTCTQKIVAVDPRIDHRWLRLARGPGGNLFTSPPWISAVCGTYGFTPEARVALDNTGVPVGGFTWVPVSDIRGDRLSSLPFSDRADPIVADGPMWDALVDDVLMPDVPLTLRALLPTPALTDRRLRLAGEAAWHGTTLDGTIDDLYRRISGHARRNISTADRHGVRVEPCSGLEGVRRFHRLHVALRKHKYRLLAQPVELFERIWHEFTADDAAVTLFACVDDEPVAGALFLEWNDVLYYKFGASLSAHLGVRPNDAIFWAAIRRGVQRGLRLVDWGLSDLDQPGLVAYKRKWATEERRIATLRSAGEAVPARVELDRVLGRLTELLTEDAVPDEVTRRAGALLYRYFC